MRDVLHALNQLVSQGVIEQYAIGGAIAATFYIDALQTEDVDAFVFLPNTSGVLLSLAPLYRALEALGGVVDREFVRFGSWPLQILTDANELIAEAIAEATTVTFEDETTRVFRAEHLCAIALQTGRAKDYLRVHMFLDQKAVEPVKLEALVMRYGLISSLKKLEAFK